MMTDEQVEFPRGRQLTWVFRRALLVVSSGRYFRRDEAVSVYCLRDYATHVKLRHLNDSSHLSHMIQQAIASDFTHGDHLC